MAELKAHRIDNIISAYKIGKAFCMKTEEEVYLKSEADEVLEEIQSKLEAKELEFANCKEDALNTDKAREKWLQLARKLAIELRHHKYKRCLAMAQEWRNYAAFCGMQSSCHNHRGFGKTADKYTWKECHAWKCMKRFMGLAEKFKEAK